MLTQAIKERLIIRAFGRFSLQFQSQSYWLSKKISVFRPLAHTLKNIHVKLQVIKEDRKILFRNIICNSLNLDTKLQVIKKHLSISASRLL